MFIRWHKRRRQPRSGKTDVHWGVALTEATRIDGKPRQQPTRCAPPQRLPAE
jgi:hypothetical protein